MELRGNISTRLKQCTAYADDILITIRTTQAMIDTFIKMKNESLKYGLIVNVHKQNTSNAPGDKTSQNP
jgi:hypothetical protein